MVCEYCNKQCGSYHLCRECDKLKKAGKLTKCENCGKWKKGDKPLCHACWVKNKQNEKDAHSRNHIIKEIDKNGYERGEIKHSDLIHRQVAYHKIYLPNKEDYSLRFSEYIVHHIDGNKLNNHSSNLLILTDEQHAKIHKINVLPKMRKEIKIESESIRNEEHNNKKKHTILLTIILVLVSIISIVIFIVPIPGTAIEVSSITVPYETQEEYTVQEPYTIYENYDVDLIYEVISANQGSTIDGLNYLTTLDIVVKNMDTETGTRFNIYATFETLNDGITQKVAYDYILSGTTKTFNFIYDSSWGEAVDSRYHVSSGQKTLTKAVTKYRDVIKTRTVTKYKLEDQETEVPKSATLYERWTKQVRWYYRVENDIDEIIEESSIITSQNSDIISTSSSTNQATTTLIQQNTKNVELEITVERLQNIISKSPEFRNLGDDSKIVITFFDGNGIEIPNTEFTITGGGKVTKGSISDYDIKLSTGYYYLPQIELSENICSALNEISRDDVRVNLQGSKLKLILKYSGLKNCVSF